jgi:hypothetical protein
MKNQFVFLFVIALIGNWSCQKKDISPDSITGGVYSSDVTVAERVYNIKHTGKYSDQNLTAARSGGIVFGGNSLMERLLYSNWEATWKGLPVVNRALGGTTWAEQIPYIDDLFTFYKPKVIVLYNGENEYLRYPVSTYKEVSKIIQPNFIKFYDKLRQRNPKAKIVIISMVACPELFKRGYEVYKSGYGYIYDIDNLNKIYKNKLASDFAATNVATRFINIKPSYQFYTPTRSYDASKFDPDGIHIQLAKYTAWVNKVKPVVDSLYRNINPAPVPWWRR